MFISRILPEARFLRKRHECEVQSWQWRKADVWRERENSWTSCHRHPDGDRDEGSTFRWWRTSMKEDKDRQCTYNVTLRRVRVTVIAVERQLVLRILSVCIIALVKRHANRRFSVLCYVVMWSVWPKHIFNVSHPKKHLVSKYHKCTHGYMKSTHHSC